MAVVCVKLLSVLILRESLNWPVAGHPRVPFATASETDGAIDDTADTKAAQAGCVTLGRYNSLNWDAVRGQQASLLEAGRPGSLTGTAVPQLPPPAEPRLQPAVRFRLLQPPARSLLLQGTSPLEKRNSAAGYRTSPSGTLDAAKDQAAEVPPSTPLAALQHRPPASLLEQLSNAVSSVSPDNGQIFTTSLPLLPPGGSWVEEGQQSLGSLAVTGWSGLPQLRRERTVSRIATGDEDSSTPSLGLFAYPFPFATVDRATLVDALSALQAFVDNGMPLNEAMEDAVTAADLTARDYCRARNLKCTNLSNLLTELPEVVEEWPLFRLLEELAQGTAKVEVTELSQHIGACVAAQVFCRLLCYFSGLFEWSSDERALPASSSDF